MAVWLEVVIAIAIPLGGSLVVSALTPRPGDWYASLDKPSWTPPNKAFPIVWPFLYILQGVASWLVWHTAGLGVPIYLYIFQLLLNFAWSPVFFKLRRLDAGLAIILVLWLAIVATEVAFWGVSKIASLLLLPYLAWVSLASALHYYIYANNAQSDSYEPLSG